MNLEDFEKAVNNVMYWGLVVSAGSLLLCGAVKLYKNISNINLTNKEK